MRSPECFCNAAVHGRAGICCADTHPLFPARHSPPPTPHFYFQYDYPSDLAENITEVGQQAQAAWASFASKNLKNTPIPVPADKPAPEHLPKTLPHALSRAAAAGAGQLTSEDRLGAALGTYAVATQKVSSEVARLERCPEVGRLSDASGAARRRSELRQAPNAGRGAPTIDITDARSARRASRRTR